MSYDLTLYVSREAQPGELVRMVHSTPEVHVVGSTQGQDDEQVQVGWQVTGETVFLVTGPSPLQPEDLPAEVVAKSFLATHCYFITVSDTSDAGITAARDFGRVAAERLAGGVLDEQTSRFILDRGVRERLATMVPGSGPAPVPPDVEVAVVDLRWEITLHPGDEVAWERSERLAEIYLEHCHRYLPAALPRRFGSSEPLRHTLEKAGDGGFIRTWRSRRTTMLHTTGTMPLIGGHLSAPVNPPQDRTRFGSVGLKVPAPALHDEGLRTAVWQLFVSLADALHCPFASAQVLEGLTLTGPRLSGSLDAQQPISPMMGPWRGLPPHPMWWAYYGAPYRDLVAPLDPRIGLAQTADGLVHTHANLPATRADLCAAYQPAAGAAPDQAPTPWIDPRLLMTLPPGTSFREVIAYNITSSSRMFEPAELIPAALLEPPG